MNNIFVTGQTDRAISSILDSYSKSELEIQHLNLQPLPSPVEVVKIIEALRELIFPGYFNRRERANDLKHRVETLTNWVYETLTEQINHAIAHGKTVKQKLPLPEMTASECAATLLNKISELREILSTDAHAAYDGDPAATCLDEIILCYPGMYSVVVYRLAHEIYKCRVPFIPRMMTEHVHYCTGVDIHPGTVIGKCFFIDHGTGVVIGSTARIGNNVKIYQGVTIGAFSFDHDSAGELIRNTKRHPTIEDDVVIYAGATILGGDTIIGHGSIIGGNVWLTHSVPPETRVLQDSPNLRFIPGERATAS
ncbi:MAG: serine O-acetyltransferase [Pyrinomonadaceae bacterium]